MSATLIDRTCVQPRRNSVAALLVACSASAVTVPPAGLTFTGYAPQITQPTAPTSSTGRQSIFIDQTVTLPKNRTAQIAAILAAQAHGNQQLQIFPGALQLQGFPPLIAINTPVYTGQDRGGDWDEPELWQPPRRDWIYTVVKPAGTTSVQAQLGQLTLTGFAPNVNLSGIIFPPVAGLAITGFSPAVSQTSQTGLAIPLGTLQLTGFSPFVGQSGGIQAPFGQLVFNALAPTITQAAVPVYPTNPRYYIQRVTSRSFTVSALTGPRFETMAPSEAVLLTFDFSPDLNPGEQLVGGPAVTYAVQSSNGNPDPNPGELANGGPGFDSTSTKAVVPVSGGIDGNNYQITVTVQTSTPLKVLTLVGILPVRVGTGV